jgi:hypothetical protein
MAELLDRGLGRAKTTDEPDGVSPPGSPSAAKPLRESQSVQHRLCSASSSGQWRGGAGGGIRREAHASGSEHRHQPMRRSTHRGLRPTDCDFVASTGYATPAPNQQRTTEAQGPRRWNVVSTAARTAMIPMAEAGACTEGMRFVSYERRDAEDA